MKGTKRNNIGSATAGLRLPLSDVEEAFFKLFTVERLSLRLAAHRRGCSLRNARQYRKRLVEKGWMDSHYNPIPLGICSPAYGGVNWTLHGLEYVVDIIAGQQDEPYLKAVEKHQGEMPCRGSTVMMFPGKLHIKVGQVFESDHPNTCAWRASDYVFTLLRVLERDLLIDLVKDRHANIHRVKGEFSHLNDRIALQPGGAQIVVFDDLDGKVRFKVDWSPGTMPEAEMPHSKYNQDDANTWKYFTDDLIKQQHYQLSELSAMMARTIQLHEQTAAGLATVAMYLQSQVPKSVQPVEEKDKYAELRRWC